MGKILGYYLMPHPPIIIPEVGKGEEKKALSTINGCKRVADDINALKPDIVIVITPHGPLFRDAIAITDSTYISGNLSNFNAPEVQFDINVDIHLSESIKNYAHGMGIPVVSINEDTAGRYNIGFELDHGSMVPLYYVNKKYKNYKLVHITYGLLSEIDLYKFGVAIKQSVELSQYNVVIIASGDLSHKVTDEGPYGYSPYGKIFDEKILKLLESGNILDIFNLDKEMIECAAECGLRSIYILSGSMEGKRTKGELLSYEAPYGIGYGVMSFNSEEYNEDSLLEQIINLKAEALKKIRESEDEYVRLARETLENYVKTRNIIDVPKHVTKEMLSERRGIFVSLKKDGDLRGCIGTISPAYKNIAEEIIRNAIEAGESDPRFSPVEEWELSDIVYSVDELMPPEETSREDLDPKKYGVIVSKGMKTGLLLPDLSGVDTVDEQLDIALRKGGIDKSENYSIKRFEVIRHK